jgi:hypothetical protein
MKEKITVHLNDQPVVVYRGMTVKHALIAADQDLYEAACTGALRVVDADGFELGLEGALSEGARIYTGKSK